MNDTTTISDDEIIEAMARAIYDAIELKRPWDHARAQEVWGLATRREATAALAAYRKVMGGE